MSDGLDFPELSDFELKDRRRANYQIPRLSEGGWETVVEFTHPRDDSDFGHRTIVTNEVTALRSERVLPLLTGSIEIEEQTVRVPWVYFPEHPLPEVREETLTLASFLCAGIEALANNGIVMVTFVNETFQ